MRFIGAGRVGSYSFNPMRCVIPSLAVGLLLSGAAASLSVAVIAQQGDAAKGGTTTAKPQTALPAVTAADNDAAAKHAKRTLCLKQAKAKKLVGAQKTSYIQDCMNAF